MAKKPPRFSKKNSSIVIAILIAIPMACSSGTSPPSDEDLGTGGMDAGTEDSSPTSDISDTGTGTGTDVPPDTGIPDVNETGSIPFTEGVSTLTGWAEPGDTDGSRAVARFYNPVNVAYRNGMLVVADFDNGKLRKVDTKTYITSSVQLQTEFVFERPFGLAFASDETLYVSTDKNPYGEKTETTGTIWKVDLLTGTAVVVMANVGRPRGLVVLPDGKIMATDYLHHVVLLVDPINKETKIVSGAWDNPGMVDGPGADARFFRPYGIGLRSDKMLVVADKENHLIRLVALDGTTSTLAGSGEQGISNGSTTTAQFDNPLGISIAGNDDVYVTDTNSYRIRRISGNQVTTIAGSGQAGFADDDNPLEARFYGMEGLSVTPDNTMLYVADGNRGEDLDFNRIRQVQLF